jgi:excisionase family DNA binding protein
MAPDPRTLDRRTPVEDLPEFLSPEEFRRYLGLGRSTVYDLLRRNELPHKRFGRVIKIPKSALQMGGVK